MALVHKRTIPTEGPPHVGEDGKLIFEQQRILERWEQFFSTLMKTDKKFEGNKGKEISEVDENILPPQLTYKQIT
jgi:hypothetical protein